jgi:dextranase
MVVNAIDNEELGAPHDMVGIVPSKAQYSLGEPIELAARGIDGHDATIRVLHDHREIMQAEVPVVNGRIVLPQATKLPASGYLVRLVSDNGICSQTAFDIDSGMIRYGFLSDFTPADGGNDAPVSWLNTLHINYVQYYDWMYRHDDYIAPSDPFTDLLGREMSMETIRERLRQASAHGMTNVAYGAIYGATNAFAAQHPESRLYDIDGNPILFFDFLSIMNVNQACEWHDHIIGEYRKALDFGFDGIHMDTYGFPKDAYDYEGRRLDLPSDFARLIDDTKQKLTRTHPGAALIFNNVGNWPVDAVAHTDQEAIYIEVWDPYTSYRSIRDIIVHAQSCDSSKQVILAAYLAPFNEGSSQGAFNALYILTAIITVLGATHLIHGEDHGIITEGYYARYYRNDSAHAIATIRRYYDYITYLAGLWTDRSMQDVSHTHFRGDNREYAADLGSVSPDPEAGSIWINIREGRDRTFVNFVNLTGAGDDAWNAPKSMTDTEPFTFRMLMTSPIASITFSTPDADAIRIEPLEYVVEDSQFGPYAVVTVPSLHVWGSLLICNA